MEQISEILLWCLIMGFATMFIWLVIIFSSADFIYKLHTRMFALEISKGTYMLLLFCCIGLWKMAVVLFFLIPWLAIKIIGK